METGSPYENPSSAVHEIVPPARYRDIRTLTRVTQLFLIVYGALLVLLTSTYPSLQWITEGILSPTFILVFSLLSLLAPLCLIVWLVLAGLNQRALSSLPVWWVWVVPLLVYGYRNLGMISSVTPGMNLAQEIDAVVALVGAALLAYLLYRCLHGAGRPGERLPMVFRLWLGATCASVVIPGWLTWRSIHFADEALDFPPLAHASFSLFAGLSLFFMAGVIVRLDRQQWRAKRELARTEHAGAQ